MKKKILVVIILFMCFVVVGCGKKEQNSTNNNENNEMTKEEIISIANEKVYNAYQIQYIINSFGLPSVNPEVTKNENNVIWYKVSTKDFKTVKEIENLIDETFDKKVVKKLKSKLNEKYKMIDNELYTVSRSECVFEFQWESAKENIFSLLYATQESKKHINIEFLNKNYKLNYQDGNWLLEDLIFEC